jgi:hypothetical protein
LKGRRSSQGELTAATMVIIAALALRIVLDLLEILLNGNMMWLTVTVAATQSSPDPQEKTAAFQAKSIITTGSNK